SRSGGARNPHVFQYTLRFLRSGGTRPSFARDGFFTNSQARTTGFARMRQRCPTKYPRILPHSFAEHPIAA
ncbi:MAG: hypothetical protein ACREYE_21265, partial [Gammaproteobacteria bacterium]